MMKKFVIEKDFFEIFPDAHIGVLICRGIDNRVRDPEKYARYLEESSSEALKYIQDPEFTQNPVIRQWRDAFYKLRPRKAPDALLKRSLSVFQKAVR